MTPRDPDYEVRVRNSFARQRAMATLGITMQRVAPGAVELEVPYRTDLTQQHGFLHAGVIATMADSACGYAAFSLMAPDAGVLTVEYKINLLAPARGQRFMARAKVLRAGRTLTVCSAEVVALDGPDETPIAVLQATIMAIQGRHDVQH